MSGSCGQRQLGMAWRLAEDLSIGHDLSYRHHDAKAYAIQHLLTLLTSHRIR